MNRLQTNIENAINQNADNIGGEEYDDTATYEEGDIVIYEGQLYVCTIAVETAEEFDNTKWQEISVLEAIDNIQPLPVGGTQGQVLTKNSSQDGDAIWSDQTGGDIVFVGDEENVPEDTKLFVDSNELANLGSEVVDSLEGNERNKAPSVKAVNDKIAEIIESGSNENGDYIKFADGTMICTVYMEVTDQAISGSYGSLYQGTRAWTFPIPFKTGTNPSVLCNQFLWGTGASFGTVASQNNTIAILRGYDAFSREAGTKTAISATAIGKWK